MQRNRALLALLLAVGLMAAVGSAVPRTTSPAPERAEAAVSLPLQADSSPAAACSQDFLPAMEAVSTTVPPGCCATQCNVDRDCNKICGKGNCACVQLTSCCRRCVY